MQHIRRAVVAMASVESAVAWCWLLKVDDCGLFRWYLNGTIETNLRGCTRKQAESALRLFVERSLQGELRIADLSERMAPDSQRAVAGLQETA